MPVGEGGRITKEIGTNVVSVSDYDTDGIVALRITVLALLLVAWSPALHAEQPSPDQPRLRSALPWLDLKSMSSTRDRPLFAQDRRKLRPPQAPAARAQGTFAQEQKRPQMTLMGIIESPDETLILLKDGTTSDFITVRSGDSVGTWRVVADTSYKARLIKGKDEITLEMFAAP